MGVSPVWLKIENIFCDWTLYTAQGVGGMGMRFGWALDQPIEGGACIRRHIQ
jgi:hypothetical protein